MLALVVILQVLVLQELDQMQRQTLLIQTIQQVQLVLVQKLMSRLQVPTYSVSIVDGGSKLSQQMIHLQF